MVYWTPKQDQRLAELRSEGLSSEQIGKRLGFSKNAVIGRAMRIDLPSKGNPTEGIDWSDAMLMQLRQFRAEGHSVPAIARRVGVTYAQARKKIDYLNLPKVYVRHTERRPKTPPELLELECLARQVAREREDTAPVRGRALDPLVKYDGCMWPVSSGRPWLFCTNAREIGVYCAHHHMIGSAGKPEPKADLAPWVRIKPTDGVGVRW